MKRVLLILVPLIVSTHLYAQSYDGWVTLNSNVSGKVFHYNVKDTQIQGFPISTIQTLLLLTDANKREVERGIYKFDCNAETLKTPTQLITLNDKVGSSLHQMLKNLCGYKQDDGYWFHYFTILSNQNTNADILYINLDKLQKVSIKVDGVQKEGIQFFAANGVNDVNLKKLVVSNIGESVMDCSESKIYGRRQDKTWGATDISLTSGSGLQGTRYNLCNGIFSGLVKPNVSANSATKAVSNSLDKAKEQCSGLGFKNGTEGFGKCVLQLSK